MKVEDCIVAVERRTAGGCLDLAFVFAREFSGPLTRLWLLCAVPSCIVVWMSVSRTTDMLIPSILIFMLFSSVFSALLVTCFGPQVFGVPISVRTAIRMWRRRFFSWCLLTFVTRFFQCLCLIVPSIFVTALAGHMPEVLYLEQTPLSKVVPRLQWLSSGGGYGRNVRRLFLLHVLWACLTVGLFILLDLLSTFLFNRPIFIMLISQSSRDFTELFQQVTLDDPAFLTTVQLSLWLPYPVIRLAWFFCYLDQRIRNECWDLQLQFRAEAARLEEIG